MAVYLTIETPKGNKSSINGQWVRSKDNRVCCSKGDCINLPKNNDIFCYKHVEGSSILCIVCKTTIASFGLSGEKSTHCAKDKLAGMINVKAKRCSVCNLTIATFGLPGNKRTHCVKHKLEGMIDLNNKNKKCIVCNKTQFRFGYPGQRPTHCAKDKLEGMVDLVVKKCAVCNITIPSYGYIGQKPTHCAKDRLPDMIDLVTKKCIVCRETSAAFGHPGQKSTHCGTHKLDGMINLKKNKCIVCSTVQSIFGHPGQKATHCVAHKLEGMIDVVNRKCVVCLTARAHYGIMGNQPTHCLKDKLLDMVNLSHKKCIVCHEIVPHYGFPGQSSRYCFKDRAEGMICDPKSKCKFTDCSEIAIYGLNNAVHCEIHKEVNEFNLVERRCNSCNLLEVLGTDGLCGNCNPENYRRTHLAKQREVESFLLQNNYTFRPDREIDNGICGKERPDFLFDAETHFVIIEVDEDQHKSRPCECEQTRMVNISQSLGMPTFFIRYNPDLYKCVNETNLLQHESKTRRLQTLKEWLDYALSRSPAIFGDFIQVQYLFYDDYQITDTPLTLVKLGS